MINNIRKQMMTVETYKDLYNKTQINDRTLFKINEFISDVPDDTSTGKILREIQDQSTGSLR